MEQSAAVKKFVFRIKSKYIERRLNRERQWPPCKSEKLVRLELVKGEQRQGYSAGQTMGECDKAIKRSPLAYSDILKAKDGRRRVRKVLVEGDAGIGKTTLCTALSEDWANEKLFREFEILLLLHLRQNQIASSSSLLGLIGLLHPSSEICTLVAKYIEEQEGNVLIVADGWDELSTEDRSEGSFLYELLFGECYSLSVVVTSRPSASAIFHKLQCIDRFVEVRGFSNENIKEFIQCEFASDRAKGSGLLAQLEGNPLIESVCSVPLNCAIVCHLWDCFDGALPTTMSDLYTKIILNVILRNIQKKPEYKSIPSLPRFDSLPDSLHQPWSLLCQLAFQTLSEDKIIFSHEDLGMRFKDLTLDSEIFCFGLLQYAESVLVDGHGVSFHFLHLTFQEYLAALYLVRQPTDKQLQLCQLHSRSRRFEMVWRFFFGLTFSVCNKPMSVDVSKPLVDNTWNTLSLCHFALEANHRAVNDLITSRIIVRTDVEFDARVAFDSIAIIHIITNLQFCHCGISIILREGCLRDEQIIALADALAGEHRNLQVKSIDIRGNRLTDDSLAVLFERGSPAFTQSLMSVDLSNNIIGLKTVDSLTSILAKSFSAIIQPSNPNCTQLNISDNPLGVDGCKALRDALCANKLANLNSLSLAGSLTSNVNTNTEVILALGSGHCSSLESLDLSGNSLGAPGGKALGMIISDLHFNFLFLTETMLSNEGVAAFSQSLKATVSLELESLYLDINGIQAAGISCLAKSVCTGRLKIVCHYNFSLANNPLGLEGVIDLVKILTSGHCWANNIDLSGCQLTTAGGSATNHDLNAVAVQQFICSQQPQAIESYIYFATASFMIDDNDFSGEGIHILAAFMYTCQRTVDELYCRRCGITSDDLKQLLVLLSELKVTFSRLESWDLSDNDIDDDGVLALIQSSSIFSALTCECFSEFQTIATKGITLDGNTRISPRMVEALNKELRVLEIITPPWSDTESFDWHYEVSLSDIESSENDHGVSSAADMEDNDVSIEPCSTGQTVTMDAEKRHKYDVCLSEAVSESGSEQEVVPLSTCSATARQVQRLDQVVDSEQDRVSKHLTGADVATIKTEHPNNLGLQKCEHSPEIEPCSTVTMDVGNRLKQATMDAEGVEQLQFIALDSEETTTSVAASESGSEQEVVPLPTCSATARQIQRLDQVMDFEHDGVSRHLGQIADAMYEWEGPIAEQLELTRADVAAINEEHKKLRLKTRAALELWKQRHGSDATYNNLIKVFERAGYKDLADFVKRTVE